MSGHSKWHDIPAVKAQDVRRAYVGAASSRFFPTPTIRNGRAGVLVPEGKIHAIARGRVLCGADDEVTDFFSDLPWQDAKNYDRCTDCVNEYRARVMDGAA